jgi:hypothetical protein
VRVIGFITAEPNSTLKDDPRKSVTFCTTQSAEKLCTTISQGKMDEQDFKQKGQRNISFLEQKRIPIYIENNLSKVIYNDLPSKVILGYTLLKSSLRDIF